MVYKLTNFISLVSFKSAIEMQFFMKHTEGDIMQITVNGEANEIHEAEVNLSKLLELRQVESPEMVAVQLNGEFVDMESYPSTFLKAGDDVDFLYFMGGGAW